MLAIRRPVQSNTPDMSSKLNDIYQFYVQSIVFVFVSVFYFSLYYYRFFLAYGLDSLINLNITQSALFNMFSTHTEWHGFSLQSIFSIYSTLPTRFLPYDQMSNVLNYSLLNIFRQLKMQRAHNFRLLLLLLFFVLCISIAPFLFPFWTVIFFYHICIEQMAKKQENKKHTTIKFKKEKKNLT